MQDDQNLENLAEQWAALNGDEAHLKESLANTNPAQFYLSDEPKPAHMFRLTII